jgi:hypothetical protein
MLEIIFDQNSTQLISRKEDVILPIENSNSKNIQTNE